MALAQEGQLLVGSGKERVVGGATDHLGVAFELLAVPQWLHLAVRAAKSSTASGSPFAPPPPAYAHRERTAPGRRPPRNTHRGYPPGGWTEGPTVAPSPAQRLASVFGHRQPETAIGSGPEGG